MINIFILFYFIVLLIYSMMDCHNFNFIKWFVIIFNVISIFNIDLFWWWGYVRWLLYCCCWFFWVICCFILHCSIEICLLVVINGVLFVITSLKFVILGMCCWSMVIDDTFCFVWSCQLLAFHKMICLCVWLSLLLSSNFFYDVLFLHSFVWLIEYYCVCCSVQLAVNVFIVLLRWFSSTVHVPFSIFLFVQILGSIIFFRLMLWLCQPFFFQLFQTQPISHPLLSSSCCFSLLCSLIPSQVG